jgi:hypothetical protein
LGGKLAIKLFTNLQNLVKFQGATIPNSFGMGHLTKIEQYFSLHASLSALLFYNHANDKKHTKSC